MFPTTIQTALSMEEKDLVCNLRYPFPQRIGLPQYTSNLLEQGYDVVEVLSELTNQVYHRLPLRLSTQVFNLLLMYLLGPRRDWYNETGTP